MTRLLPLAAALLLVPHAGRAADPPVVVRVVGPDGRPAAAAVWAGANEHAAGADGRVTLPGVHDPWRHHVFARDADGRIGAAWRGWVWDEDAPAGEAGAVRVVLAAPAPRPGRITTADGKPVAGAEVIPTAFAVGGDGRPHAALALPPAEQARLAARTDADGRFTLAALPGHGTAFRVRATGFGEVRFFTPTGAGLDVVLAPPGTVAVSLDGVEPAALKGVGWRLDPAGRDAATPTGPRPVRGASGTFDGAALTVRDLPPGRYRFTVEDDGYGPAVFEAPVLVEVEAGRTAALTAVFRPGATVTGRVIDEATGQGVAGAAVRVSVEVGGARAAPGQRYRELRAVTTDADGRFTATGPRGAFTIERVTAAGYVTSYPDAVPHGPWWGHPSPWLEGGRSFTFLPVPQVRPVTRTGRVVFADGRPAAGALVVPVLRLGDARTNAPRAVTDRDGRFTLADVPPRTRFLARAGVAVHGEPAGFDREKKRDPNTIEVGDDYAARLLGRVTDGRGEPVAGARVTLGYSFDRGDGRLATATTRADGWYTFTGVWPNSRYLIEVAAEGFLPGTVRVNDPRPDTPPLGTLALARADRTAAGRVVDAAGRPVAGAEVFAADGPTTVATVSGPDGAFALTGFPEGGGFVLARKPGLRPAAVALPDAGPVTVRLSAEPAPAAAFPPELAAAQERLARHVLTRRWERNDPFDRGNVVTAMAFIDPALAAQWNDEVRRPFEKSTLLLDRAAWQKGGFELARRDIDAALALLERRAGHMGDERDYIQLGERLLPTDPAKAARVAEVLAARAATISHPRVKAEALAGAGDILARVVGAPGLRFVAEAAGIAEGVMADEKSAGEYQMVARVAARLAPHDWPRAERLMNRLKDPFHRNHYCLHHVIPRLAETDLPKAKELLKDGGLATTPALTAFRLALTKPDEAEKLVAEMRSPGDRVLGYIGLARRVADPARAARLIDTAFSLLEADPDRYRQLPWDNLGAESYAALAAVRARELGHPDAAGLVARALALRPAGDEVVSAAVREERLVGFAAVLALADPAAARGVLAGLAAPGRVAARAGSDGQGWVLALGLCDPDRVVPLTDQLLGRLDARRGRSLYGTGLYELPTVLTAADRYRALMEARWHNVLSGLALELEEE